MSEFYDGTKLLSMKDIDGNEPEIFISTSNRSAGKTTYFNRLAVNRWNKRRSKFALLYRYKYELSDVADKFYKDIRDLFFPNSIMTSKSRASGIYHELMINDECCGYALALNSADQLKKYSHLFSDVELILFDEFQSETNSYCPQEIRKFISIHTSIARGGGKQVRRVLVIMISNPVSIINPYYVELGISSRLNGAHYLRGKGFVLEQGFVESASKCQKESAFNQAFENNEYVAYSSECVYLNDNEAFIEKPTGVPRYLGTIRYEGTDYAIKEYREMGILYCDNKADLTYPNRISVTTDDHRINYVMLKNNDLFIMNMRFYFEHGAFRFKDLKCKEALMKLISY